MAVGDLVVVVPGIMGSALVDADGREVWGAGGIVRGLETLAGSVKALRLPAQFGNDPAPDGVRATRLMNSFHAIPGIWTPVVGYDTLLKFLRGRRVGLIDAANDGDGDAGAPVGNLVAFAYDWRLSNRRSAHELGVVVERALDRWRASSLDRAETRVVFVCHSMGGLVARWYVERLGGAAHTRLLITLGTPYRGAMNAVDQLVSGVRKGVKPLRVDLTAMARSFPSVHQLLPEYACIESSGQDLAKTTELALPWLDPAMVADAMAFHDELDQGAAPPFSHATVPFVGIRQKTWTTCRIDGDCVELCASIGGENFDGDGTVPRLSARPKVMSEQDPVVRGVAEGHGSLIANASVFDDLESLLTGRDRIFRDVERSAIEPAVAVDSYAEVGEPIVVEVEVDDPRLVEVAVTNEADGDVGLEPVVFSSSTPSSVGAAGTATVTGLSPGGYQLIIRGPDDPAGDSVVPVRRTLVVLPT